MWSPSQRGANQSSSVRADLDLGVLQPYIGTGGLSTKARLNHEIDERARHNDRTDTERSLRALGVSACTCATATNLIPT